MKLQILPFAQSRSVIPTSCIYLGTRVSDWTWARQVFRQNMLHLHTRVCHSDIWLNLVWLHGWIAVSRVRSHPSIALVSLIIILAYKGKWPDIGKTGCASGRTCYTYILEYAIQCHNNIWLNCRVSGSVTTAIPKYSQVAKSLVPCIETASTCSQISSVPHPLGKNTPCRFLRHRPSSR